MDLQPRESDVFVHSGVVSKILGRSVIVSLDKNVHCDSCSARGACGMGDSPNREIEVRDPGESFKLQEKVKVTLQKGLGQKAVFWAYIFPFALLLMTLMTASLLFAEWVAGLLSLFVLIPYYAILYLRRNYFQKTFRVSILKT